jgi:hypothetical protein
LGATQYISKTDLWLLKLRLSPLDLSMPAISAQFPRSVRGSEVAIKPYESGMTVAAYITDNSDKYEPHCLDYAKVALDMRMAIG